jgi:hypothetical protein
MQCVRDKDDFPVHEEDELPNKGVEITISRFSIKENGFLLWIDFTVPQPNGFAIGTCEITLSNTGSLNLIRTVGQMLKKRSGS